MDASQHSAQAAGEKGPVNNLLLPFERTRRGLRIRGWMLHLMLLRTSKLGLDVENWVSNNSSASWAQNWSHEKKKNDMVAFFIYLSSVKMLFKTMSYFVMRQFKLICIMFGIFESDQNNSVTVLSFSSANSLFYAVLSTSCFCLFSHCFSAYIFV